MDIRVYDMEGITPSTCLGIIDDYQSVNFTKSFKKVGQWTIKGYLTDKVKQIIEPNNMIYLSPRICGIIDGVEFITETDGTTTYTAYGSELKNLLSYRVLLDNLTAPTGTTPTIETWMRMIARANCIEAYAPHRGVIHYLDTTANNVSLNNIGTQQLDTWFAAGENVQGLITDLATYYDTNDNLQLGWDVVCGSDMKFYFTLYEGLNKTMTSAEPLVLSRDFDNVAQLAYTRSTKNNINVVLVGGEDILALTPNADSKEGLDRREMFVDVSSEIPREVRDTEGVSRTMSDAEYIQRLQAKGQTYYQATLNTLEAESTMYSTRPPDYDLLGATVNIMDKSYGVQSTDWISEINFIDEQGELEINYTVGSGIQARYLMEV